MSDLWRATPRAGQPVSSVEGYREEGKQLSYPHETSEKRLGRQGGIPGTEDLVKMEYKLLPAQGASPRLWLKSSDF